MKKIILASILILTLMLSLTSCGSASSESKKDSGSKKSSTTVTIECPEELNYTAKFMITEIIYSSCKLDNIKYSVDDSRSKKSLNITYDITKTFDNKGNLGDTAVSFRYILYSSDGSIVKNGSIDKYEMIVNQKLKNESFSIELESIDSSYKLVFIDYTI